MIDLKSSIVQFTKKKIIRHNKTRIYWPIYTNCYSKCRIANFEFTKVNADRPIKQQIEPSENMRHFIG